MSYAPTNPSRHNISDTSMEPSNLFASDRSVFDTELEGLIGGAAIAASSPDSRTTPYTTLTSPTIGTTTDAPLERQLIPQPCMAKRPRLDTDTDTTGVETPSRTTSLIKQDSEISSPLESTRSNSSGVQGNPLASGDQHSLHVHPSRMVLLDRRDAHRLRDIFCPTPTSTTTMIPSSRQPTAAALSLLSNIQSEGSSHSISALPTGPKLVGKTWNNSRNAIKRQWDATKDDMDYESLLELRRKEKLENVDRYVPEPGHARLPRHSPHSSVRKAPKLTSFPFQALPEKAQNRILEFLLTSSDPIKIDFTWLRTFVNGHSRIPVATKTILHGDSTYHVPVTWNQLVTDVSLMQSDMKPFHFAMEERAIKTRKVKAPCRGLTTSLLRVSRKLHEQAARALYSRNTFWFPWPTAAWMQLESFVATIGPTNVSYLRKLRVHAPLWHCGVQEDFAEGAILDLTSPASRLAVIKPPAHDRLLSAIQSVVHSLMAAGHVTALSFDLEHGRTTDLWSTRYVNDAYLVSTADAEEYVTRKQRGVELLRQASESLAAMPMLTLYSQSFVSHAEAKEAKEKYTALVVEAEKYGWEADPVLRGRRMV